MPIVNSRDSLKEYCFRKLGAPVMQINVDDDQVDDRINDAIDMFREYHSDAMIRNYIAIQLTPTMIAEKMVSVPEDVFSVVKVFPLTNGSLSNMNISYVAAMSDIMDSLRTGKQQQGAFRYMLIEQHLSLLQQFFSREKIIRFNRFMSHVKIDTDWTLLTENDYVLFEVWQAVDMDNYDRLWSNFWLESYTTALIKQQWGMNMIKYDGFQLPSGITLNGRQIYDDATNELKELMEELQNTWQYPTDFYIG